MSIYTTLDGELLDLSGLKAAERAFFERCYSLWRSPDERSFTAIRRLIFGAENPILEEGRRVTRRVAAQPLFQAVQDLEARIGIVTGNLGPEPNDEPEKDPLGEEFVTIAEAAKLKGITVPAVHAAIDRGDLIAVMETRPAKVSRTSLQRWQINADRQRAGRKQVVAHA